MVSAVIDRCVNIHTLPCVVVLQKHWRHWSSRRYRLSTVHLSTLSLWVPVITHFCWLMPAVLVDWSLYWTCIMTTY